MKLFKKSIMAIALVSISIGFTANASTQIKAAHQAASASKSTDVTLQLQDAKQQMNSLKSIYPTLKIDGLESISELKSVKFNFEELLKASNFAVDNYGKNIKTPSFDFVQLNAATEKKLKAKFDKLSEAEKQKYSQIVNQALMQAPVLAYYDYLTTGQVPTQKNIYALAEYQNKRFGQVRLIDLPIALTGNREDAMMNLLLSRIATPLDTNIVTIWYNQNTKMNTQPIKAQKPLAYGELFAQARSNLAKVQQAQAQKEKPNTETKPKS